MKNSAANAASSVIGGDGTNANGKVLRYTFYAYTTAETAQDLYVQLNGNSSGVQSFIMSAADLYSPDSIPHKIDLYVWSDSKDKVVFGSTDTNTSEYVYLAAVMDGNRFIKCARGAEKNNSAMKATSGNLYPTIFYLLQQKKDTTEFTVTATDAYIMHPNAEKGWEQIDRANVCDNLFKNINIGASGTTTLTTTDKEGFVTGFGEYTTAMETALASVGAGESASIEIFDRDYNAPASIYDNYDSSNVKVVDSYGKVLTAAEVASLTSLDNHYFVINGVYVNIESVSSTRTLYASSVDGFTNSNITKSNVSISTVNGINLKSEDTTVGKYTASSGKTNFKFTHTDINSKADYGNGNYFIYELSLYMDNSNGGHLDNMRLASSGSNAILGSCYYTPSTTEYNKWIRLQYIVKLDETNPTAELWVDGKKDVESVPADVFGYQPFIRFAISSGTLPVIYLDDIKAYITTEKPDFSTTPISGTDNFIVEVGFVEFKNIDKIYKPIPFWSWNEKLKTEETRRQVRLMYDAGIGGYFMHARGGLQTEYLGDDWFENVESAIEEGEKLGMHSWAYDENGWPSGFGAGVVNSMGIEYQQKYLRVEDTFEHKDTHICYCGGKYFYYDINPFYVDTLDKKVIAEFIKVAYEPYYEKFGNRIEGFFTDEPQISRNGIPWSFVFEEEYKARYNDDLYTHLHELFFRKGDYKTTRIRFWKMVTDLFSSAYMKQICNWCDERNLKLTGHLVRENTFETQLTSNGACMPHYEYFHIPGMDWLGRNIRNDLTTMQVSSVAEQLGKKQVLSETFALCGHNVSFAELKGIYEWQMVHGINLLCQHLEGYSNRGIRKRDYPPAMYYQQPWWEDYHQFNDAMSRVSMILAEGKKEADVLVIHPQTTAWTMYDECGIKELTEFYEDFKLLIERLEAKHIKWHFGDETIMERHGKVKDGKIVIGNQEYKYVINYGCKELLENTKKLLDEYKAQGGKFVNVDDLPYNDVTDSEKLTYKSVIYEGYKVHYFVNTSAERFDATFKVQGKLLDIYTGELSDFNGKHNFEPWGSLMVVEDNTKNIEFSEKDITIIKPQTEYLIAGEVENALTLDKCDYYFDGVLQEKEGYVLNISTRANSLGHKVKILQDYHVNFNYIPDKLYLVCETPWVFDIKVNDVNVEYSDCGYFRDISFKKIEISKYVKLGKNTISFDCDFKQSEKVYENLEKSYIFESEKNKLYFDMEIESIYLVGDFAVATPGKWEKLGVVDGYENVKSFDNTFAYRYSGEFVIEKPVEKVNIKDIQKQGFPFFAGALNLVGDIDIKGNHPVLELDMYGVNSVHVKVDGKEFVAMTDNRIPLTGISEGVHKIELTIINNLRNLLGPHHLEGGESLSVNPAAFYDEDSVFSKRSNPVIKKFNPNYCFVEMKI